MRWPILDASPYGNPGALTAGALAETPIVGTHSLTIYPDYAGIAASGACLFANRPQYALGAGQPFFVEGLARRGYALRAGGYRDGLFNTSGWLVEINDSTGRLTGNVGGVSGTSVASIVTDQLFAWAFGRTADGQGHLFLDGVHSTFPVSNSALGPVDLVLGAYTQPGFVIDEVRFTVGTCRHTTDYAPSYDAAWPEGIADPLWDQVVLLTHCDPMQAPTFGAVGMPEPLTGSPAVLGLPPRVAGSPSREIVDREHGGRGRVTGTVKNKGTPNTPVHRRVRLFAERAGAFIAETWSDPVTGAYAFEYLKMGIAYTVVSYDHTLAYRAVLADRVLPELMPA